MPIDLDRFFNLPVTRVLAELTGTLTHRHAVVSAPTGSGKTTLIPLALLSSPLLAQGKILLLEPRRIAARAAARRMSEMLGQECGNTVGYRTRFESQVSNQTRIEVITEGILVRMLQNDPGLEEVRLIIFDEFHERNLLSDLALALCLDLCQISEDLRLLVMSATLQAETICALLGNVPHITASGRSYPVAIHHFPPASASVSLAAQMTSLISKAWREQSGDLLAFLPGTAEIRSCEKHLEQAIPEALILPLYGNLNHKEQDRVFDYSSGRRRIILATPVAETSLTIDHIGCVVDSGYCRRPVHDPGSGLSRLSTMRISKASADQRAGRAGRTGPGACYRLWSKETEHGLLPQTPPEIVHGDLAPLVLELALWGVTDPTRLGWLDPPRPSAWNGAVTLLQDLSLLTPQGTITDRGRQCAGLPAHPRLAAVLLEGKELGLARTACLTAAVLSERDILADERSADIEERVRLLETFSRDKELARHRFDSGRCRFLLRQVEQWLKSLGAHPENKVSTEHIGTLLAFGFPDRVAQRRSGSRCRYLLAGGGGAALAEDDILSGSEYLVAPRIDNRHGDGKIFLAAQISEQQIRTTHLHHLTSSATIRWDSKEKRVEATSDTLFGALTLNSTPLPSPPPHKLAECLLSGIRQEGIDCLPFSAKARTLQARVCSLHHWFPDRWPDWSDTQLQSDLDWLAPYCHNLRSLASLQNLDLAAILASRLSWEQQRELEEFAPTHIRVPSGSRLPLAYRPGESPVLAVRLQEMFGLVETPKICRQSVPVLLHLLSPARRPLQITADLGSFWQNGYPEIRRELAGRYPKHYWPTDPMAAAATTKTKKQLQAGKKN